MSKLKSLKGLLIFIFCLLMLICTTSCGQTSAKGETAIEQDISLEDSYYSNYDLSIESFNITKRQTNYEDKTDYVWVEVTASNNDFTYYAEYSLVYVLYNDGWILEDCERDVHSVCPAAESLTWEDADACIASLGYQNWEHSEVKGDTAVYTFFYLISENAYYLQTTKQIGLTYTFSPDKLWGEPKVSEEIVDWSFDILGEWVYQNGEQNFYVNIMDIDMSGGTMTLEYSLENRKTYVINSPVLYETKSDGTETVKMQTDYVSGTYIAYISDISVYVGTEKELTNGGYGCGVSVDGYWLTKR